MSEAIGPRPDAAIRGEPSASPARGGGAVPLFSFGPWFWASAGVLMAALVAVTGVGLLAFFAPGSGASKSLSDLEAASGFGFLRDLHAWAGHALVLAAWLHLARVFIVGAYRRRLGWRVTAALVVLITVGAWLGEETARGTGDNALLVYAAHVALVPLAIVGLAAAWATVRRRGYSVAESVGAAADSGDGRLDGEGVCSEQPGGSPE
ncbi:MAG: hypothetical protein AAGM22_26830 [Acidobacteriota bacterium]